MKKYFLLPLLVYYLSIQCTSTKKNKVKFPERRNTSIRPASPTKSTMT